MPLSNHAIETFISDKITKVTRCGAAELGAEFPARGDWLKSYTLSAVFNDTYAHDRKGLALLLIRRVESSIDAYDAGRAHLLQLVSTTGGGRLLPYVRALSSFEVSITQLYTAYQAAINHEGIRRAYEKDDGSDVQRLSVLYNIYRHGPVTSDQQMWITNAGFECDKAALSFGEYEAMLRTWARLALAVAEGKRDAFDSPP